VLHLGVPEFLSQIQPNHAFDSDIAAYVVVAAIAGPPLDAADDTAHWIPLVHVGGALEFGVGVALVLQISR
jgi:hypothetical protein